MKSLIPVWNRAINYVFRPMIGLLLGLSMSAMAGPAQDFVAANRAQQATLLQQWATEPDASQFASFAGAKTRNSSGRQCRPSVY